MYIYIYVYKYVFVHLNIYLHICIYMNIHIFKHICTYIYSYMYMYTYIYSWIAYIYICIHIHINMCVRKFIHECTYTYIFIYNLYYLYHICHWKGYIPEIHQIEKLTLLGISRYQFESRFWSNWNLHWVIWVSRFGGFRGCSTFSDKCHILIFMNTCTYTHIHVCTCWLQGSFAERQTSFSQIHYAIVCLHRSPVHQRKTFCKNEVYMSAKEPCKHPQKSPKNIRNRAL